jgi:hypothetical protein
VRIAAVPSCRPRAALADCGEILAYHSPLCHGLECASLFGYGIELSKLRDAC